MRWGRSASSTCQVDESHARVIAGAIARAGVGFRRSGLAAGVAALCGCALTIYVDLAAQKAVSLALTILCAIASYRTIRLANEYVDPTASPVLAALAKDPRQIASVSVRAPSRSPVALVVALLTGAATERVVVVTHRSGAELPLPVPGKGDAAAAAAAEILSAFEAIAPEAEIQRELE